MTGFAVITPSYAPDAELFGELHESVLTHTDAVHHVLVPGADRALFARHAGPRCRVWTYGELLPRRYVPIPKPPLWVNLRRPWPPVRGWVLQQALKIAAAARFDADSVLLADSDVVLVRETTPEVFQIDGTPGLYRNEGAVHAGMRRHVRWHQVARRLLGVPGTAHPPLPDYVSPFNVWEPEVVRAMQARITEVTGRHWFDAFTAELHISEFILYGVFVDEVLGGTPRFSPSPTMFCHTYWDTAPLDEPGAREFALRRDPDSLALMISAKSGTPREARLAATRACGNTAGEQRGNN
ncbi:DUF6492 family protein [Amycolatopsis sp. CA-230715]|uniref:DUF6492 family protein n=1 Tax=Amycolatopsis sp. CA-230715 TaxID=2745196 RepID=UPI001C009B88|nr:DUF6492 family protein [Amycolatopsis sp. CA-230715]QWF79805.1 hypothetical protein HUW46_03218 [Amycolatopsis sp. CA-230715]